MNVSPNLFRPKHSVRPTLLSSSPDNETSSARRTKALVTGSVALGAYLTGVLVRRANRSQLLSPDQLPPALDASVKSLELMEGCARFYERPGTGVPLVLMHSFNAAASSYEMKPIFDHFAEATTRPLYGLDWFGFGLSDRPPVQYRPELYIRQLRRFLSEHVQKPADVVALSLGCEYAAFVAADEAILVRRLACVAPTNLSGGKNSSWIQQALLGAAATSGAFELFFHHLTRRSSLRQFYARQIFSEDDLVPEALVDYAFQTSHVLGAHYAPLRFIDGTLFLGQTARTSYASLSCPTLLIIPQKTEGLVQSFDGLDALYSLNPSHLDILRVESGLLPHWETPHAVLPALTRFLEAA